jgi:hypothetical protein
MAFGAAPEAKGPPPTKACMLLAMPFGTGEVALDPRQFSVVFSDAYWQQFPAAREAGGLTDETNLAACESNCLRSFGLYSQVRLQRPQLDLGAKFGEVSAL